MKFLELVWTEETSCELILAARAGDEIAQEKIQNIAGIGVLKSILEASERNARTYYAELLTRTRDLGIGDFVGW